MGPRNELSGEQHKSPKNESNETQPRRVRGVQERRIMQLCAEKLLFRVSNYALALITCI